jgi:hypothetical protein
MLAVTATVWAAIAATVRAAIATRSKARRWTILRRVIARCEILRSRFVRIGLTLVVRMRFVYARRAGFRFFDVGVNIVMFKVGVAWFS